MNVPDYYALFGVAPTADAAVIQASYKRLALQYHPDRNSNPSAERIMRSLNEAYEVLSDPERRRAYDAALSRRRATEQRTVAARGQQGCLVLAGIALLFVALCHVIGAQENS